MYYYYVSPLYNLTEQSYQRQLIKNMTSENVDPSYINKDDDSETEDNIDEADEVAADDEPAMESAPQYVPMSDDDIKKRVELIQLIDDYRDHPKFCNMLRFMNLQHGLLESLSLPELEDLVKQVKYKIGMTSTGSFWSGLALYGVGAVECVGPAIGLRTHGLTLALQRDQEFDNTVAEITMKHKKYIYIEPEYRLAMILLKSITAIHVNNSNIEEANIAANKSKTVDADTVNKYKDL